MALSHGRGSVKGKAGSVLPEIFESARRQVRVLRGVLYVVMTEVHLNRPSILAIIREVIAASMSQLVRVHGELNPCGFAGFRHDVVNCAPRHRPSTQQGEHIGRRIGLLASKRAKPEARARESGASIPSRA